MDCKSRYTDLIYFAHGDVAACRYRFFLISADPKQVVLQLDNHRGQRGILISDHQTRDGILNRIADRELDGIPFAMLCVALSENNIHHVVSAEPDLEDYIHRGHPYRRIPEKAARGRHIERISIDSRNLTIGRARIQTAHDTPTLTAPDLASLLNSADIGAS
ncbi:hypothetical protein ABWH74_001539 [Burkholderia vietnamiensis]|jgi:hypothetical protein|uniref:Uncharacterized protein n=1 Tax=Burkholderia vietnamiensis (strain G4 / LMG 22486) TaxID=269482 RepID=A4JUR7_BURVG|nr:MULTISPECIES: hypothetical protein [Burkholderia]ABO60020.1 hypothetical protein Bcep1808_7138 [Burkholderia vietnamiensis G4]KVE73369.1 hypothetical protein WI98_19835 [Burkholderia vietnamiensis]KVF02215.1 hypothetical protein WJ03_05155 [Burkholderia vietnamiensis]KVF63383.1 hypothetical protein WJ17_26920 [Burkholderia vietnamiensis]KVR74621.1 hypothetical protein WK24_00245 [Burkholderia vietnamiensis]